MIVGDFLCGEIERQLCVNDYYECDTPIFLVTLIPADGRVSADLCGIDLATMKVRVQADLRGCSYVGTIEPGYYASLPSADNMPGPPIICWHSHLLIWNITTSQIEKVVRKLRSSDRYRAVVEELKSAHAKQVANGELPETVAYILKPPSHAYRVTRYPWMDEGGEPRLEPDGTPRFYVRQFRSDLRPGERVRVFHAMKHLAFSELLLAGGEGRALRAGALRLAGEKLNRQQHCS
jgi:hypothetical protein